MRALGGQALAGKARRGSWVGVGLAGRAGSLGGGWAGCVVSGWVGNRRCLVVVVVVGVGVVVGVAVVVVVGGGGGGGGGCAGGVGGVGGVVLLVRLPRLYFALSLLPWLYLYLLHASRAGWCCGPLLLLWLLERC